MNSINIDDSHLLRIKQGKSLAIADILVDSFKVILEQPTPDLPYLACLLSLPAESYLAEQIVSS
jgi:aminopeptidase N